MRGQNLSRPARSVLIALATCIALALSASSAMAEVIYSTANDGSGFATINPATAAGTVIGSGHTNSCGYAAALDTDGTLWGVTNCGQLVKVNKTTGAITPVGVGLGMGTYNLEVASDGTMYSLSYDGNLYKVNKTTGIATRVGYTGVGSVMDITFDCAGTLWATTGGGLWTINTTTGASTFRSNITGVNEGSGSIMGLMVDSTCQMYATAYAPGGSLYKVNPTTGAATRVGSTGLTYPHGGDFGVQGNPDADGDGVADNTDNCPNVANANQANADGDSLGDACDPDDDNDGVADTADQCPGTASGTLVASDGCADPDGDGVSNHAGDNCPDASNPDQANADGDAQGDACDPDDDNDGVADTSDQCAGTPSGTLVAADGCPDPDGDGISTHAGDNCPNDSNASQADNDADGQGDACDPDDDNDGVPDSSDNAPLNYNPDQQDLDNDGIGDVIDHTVLPINKDQCKNDGWKRFYDGSVKFKNQGDCVSFVATGGKNLPAGPK